MYLLTDANFDIEKSKTSSHVINLPVFLGELSGLKEFLGDRDLGSDEKQQVDGETQ